MLIDWFTITAQVINFLILLALLKIFLFDKIKNAMDQRENDIQARFDTAEKQKKEAQKALDDYKAQIKSFHDDRDARLKKVDKEVKDRKTVLVKEARQEVDALKKNWQNALEKQKTSFWDQFQKQAARLIFDTVQKTLSFLADTNAQDQAVKHFLTRLKDLDKGSLPDTLETPPQVSTGFKLSEKQQKSIQQAVSQKLADVQQIEFNVRPELIFGIALFAGGKKITWHAQDYLASLEKELNQAIEGKEGH